ncbi:MAG: 2OG-Fe(II) oxygenase [Bacteroidota bacterium]|nr:2OG-Fe(II) oxygenase [Kiloniellaceae bacterium]
MASQGQAGGAFVNGGRFEPGDRIPPFTLPDTEGRPVNPASDHLAGRPLLLVFECAGQRAPDFAAELSALGDRADALAAAGVLVLSITRRSSEANRDLVAGLHLPFPTLSDARSPEGKSVYAACGLDPAAGGCAAVTLVLDANLRVVARIKGGAATRWPDIAEALAAATAEPEGALAIQAPVLVLPRVLSAEDCARLVQVWHRPVRQWEAAGFETSGFHEAKGDFKVLNKDYGTVVQMVVRDAVVQRYLDTKLQRRVMPEILKAFQTKVSRREDYRIACYDAAEGGSLGAHRDNPTPQTRHRRFTMTVGLNGGAFEGGALRFPEYSRRGYLVPTGTAIVWSCSLLHEVLPVTSGRRFILGTHLFGN